MENLILDVQNAQNNESVKETIDALTLGHGFHRFNGEVTITECMEQIGANYNVGLQELVRLTPDQMTKLVNGEPITDFALSQKITSHKASVMLEQNHTLGVVGADYGVIQNKTAFDLFGMLCDPKQEEHLQIVSAGLVDNYDPYIQAVFPYVGKVEGDKSDTAFYCFAHTSHDGTSALQIRFSPVRVICKNTFMANISSKIGLSYKHSKFVLNRVDLENPENIKRIAAKLSQFKQISTDYIEQMNAFARQKVGDKYINDFIAKVFDVSAKERENFEALSTRKKNLITDFKDTLYSDSLGQDFAVGTKVWLFNGLTNYLSNTAGYGNSKDTEEVYAQKRFDSMLKGGANLKFEKGYEFLTKVAA